MLTAEEQETIMTLAQKLFAAKAKAAADLRSNRTTPRLARARIERAEDSLRDYLKGAG